jgi:hypothetical protein
MMMLLFFVLLLVLENMFLQVPVSIALHLHRDYEVWLEKLAPHEPASAYRHNRLGKG